jgi:hypothetical protein
MKSWRSVLSFGAIVCAFALVACGGSKPSSPTTPSGPSGPPAELRLSGLPDLNLPGDQFHLTLTVTDGTGTDPGSAASWRSSSPEVAAVNAGDVRVLTPGETTITATYLGLAASTKLVVTSYGSVDGVVHEKPPTQTKAIAGATIAVTSGRFDGRSTQTDTNGRFHLDNVAGALALRVSHPDFETRQLDAGAVPQQLDLALAPPASNVTEVYGFPFTVPSTRSIKEEHFSFAIHNPGAIQMTIQAWHTPYVGDGGDYLLVELLKDSAVVARMRNCDGWGFAQGFCTSTISQLPERSNVAAEEGQTYTIRISSERFIITGYGVTVTRPR